MQSLLQYRRFEKRLREQVERHGVAATSGVKPSEPAPAKDNTDTVYEPKDLESGFAPPTDIQEHALKEKEGQLGVPIIQPPPNDTLHHEATAIDENHAEGLSGSTTRPPSSASSDDDGPDLGPPLSAATTHHTVGTRLGQALTGVNVRSRATNEGGHEKGRVFVVGFVDENDPMNPHNWSKVKRMAVTILVASIGLIVGFASSVDSAALTQARMEFRVSEVVESLATGIYLIGFGQVDKQTRALLIKH